MKKLLLLLLGALLALPALARDFTYTYEGQTLTYTVIDEEAKTCQTKGGDDIKGALMIPAKAFDTDGVEYAVIALGYGSFAGCNGLTSVNIPDGVSSFADEVFTFCENLKTVYLPSDLMGMSMYNFFMCSSLESVYYNAEKNVIDVPSAYNVFGGCPENAILYVPESAVEKCKEYYPWNQFKNVVAYDFNSVQQVPAADERCEIYNLNGMKMRGAADDLAPGIYIVRQGESVKKISVNK